MVEHPEQEAAAERALYAVLDVDVQRLLEVDDGAGVVDGRVHVPDRDEAAEAVEEIRDAEQRELAPAWRAQESREDRGGTHGTSLRDAPRQHIGRPPGSAP